MKEYTIVIQHGAGKPFSLKTYNSFDACYSSLLQMIHSNKVRKEYYVCNDFYKNEYPPFLEHMTKYTIKVRNITEWEIYSIKKHAIVKDENGNTNNVVNLYNEK